MYLYTITDTYTSILESSGHLYIFSHTPVLLHRWMLTWTRKPSHMWVFICTHVSVLTASADAPERMGTHMQENPLHRLLHKCASMCLCTFAHTLLHPGSGAYTDTPQAKVQQLPFHSRRLQTWWTVSELRVCPVKALRLSRWEATRSRVKTPACLAFNKNNMKMWGLSLWSLQTELLLKKDASFICSFNQWIRIPECLLWSRLCCQFSVWA